MDASTKISYLEKLAFIQYHYGNFAPLADAAMATVDDIKRMYHSGMLESKLSRKTRGDDAFWQKLPIFGIPLQPEEVDCRGNLIMKIRNKFGRVPLATNQQISPYPHKIYTGQQATSQGITSNWLNQTLAHQEWSLQNVGASTSKQLHFCGGKMTDYPWQILPVWPSGGSRQTKDADSGVHFIQINLSLIPTKDDYFFENCGCQKRVNVFSQYENIIKTDAVLPPACNQCEVKIDYFTQAACVLRDMTTNQFSPLGFGTMQTSDACQMAVNPSFVTSASDAASKLTSLIADVLKTDSNATTNSIISSIQGNTSSLAGSLVTLGYTPQYLHTGSCGPQTHDKVLLNNTTDIYISPGQIFELTLSSQTTCSAQGTRHWFTEGSQTNRALLALFFYSDGNSVGWQIDATKCCSEQAGVYISNQGYCTQGDNKAELEYYYDFISTNGWLAQYCYPGLSMPNILGHSGAIFGNSSGCEQNVIFDLQKQINLVDTTVKWNGAVLKYPDAYSSNTATLWTSAGSLLAKGKLSETSPLLTTCASGMYLLTVAALNSEQSIVVKILK
jgi:hypothetical protein